MYITKLKIKFVAKNISLLQSDKFKIKKLPEFLQVTFIYKKTYFNKKTQLSTITSFHNILILLL